MRMLAVSGMLALTSCAHWQAVGPDIHNTNPGNVGIGAQQPKSKLTVVDTSTTPVKDFNGLAVTINSPTEARAVYGASLSSNGLNNYGGYFSGAGQSGGVFGVALDQALGSAGGVFHAYGTRGKGVIGLAVNEGTDSSNYGGWFDARGRNGIGIWAKGGAEGRAAVFVGNVLIASHTSNQPVLELGEGLDIAEGFPQSPSLLPHLSAGSVVIIDSEHPGTLTASDRAYDRRVAGIVAGAGALGSGVFLGGAPSDLRVALVGRVYCNVDASMEGVQPGDLLTTSTTPGYAMRASDADQAVGATLGKAMEYLPKGSKGQILVLVTLQ